MNPSLHEVNNQHTRGAAKAGEKPAAMALWAGTVYAIVPGKEAGQSQEGKDELSANSCGRIPRQEQARKSTKPNSGHAKSGEKRPFLAKNGAFWAKKRGKLGVFGYSFVNRVKMQAIEYA
jgi:hypothetical protein